MRISVLKSATCLVAFLAIAGCSGRTRAADRPVLAELAAGGVLLTDSVPSEALRGNALADPHVRQVTVYLPPSYRRGSTRYPVLYLLHGFQGTDAAWLRGPQYQQFNIHQAMDSLVAAGAVREMIVVMPDARNSVGGSFYMDSPVTGGWERFTAHEVVQWVDAHYRTIPQASARGVAGHSMGGFGALRLAARYGGDVYGAAYALSPCCARVRGTPGPAWGAAWDSLLVMRSLQDLPRLGFASRVNLALALALSPAPTRAGVPAMFPYDRRHGRLVLIDSVARVWNGLMPIGAIPAGAARLRMLSGIRMDVGDADALVPVADVMALDSLLAATGARHRTEVYPGTHGSRIRERMVREVLPFFSRALAREARDR